MTSSKNNAKEYIILGVIYTFIIVPLIYFGIVKELGVYILPAVAALPLLYFVFRKPEVWLYTSIGLFVFFTRSREADVSALDYFFAIYYIGGIVLWLGWQILVKREKIVRNYADIFILLFALGVLFNFFTAYFSDVDPIKWLREGSLLFLILFYLPIRHYFSEEKKLKPFMIFFAIVLIITSALTIYSYYYALSDMEYAYQLASGDKINQLIFTTAIIFGLVFTFYQRKRLNEIYLLIFVGILSIALILTFSRTFWLIIIIMATLLFFFLPNKKRISMIKVGTVLIALSIAAFFVILGDKTEMISVLIEKRFTSSSAGVKDVSLQSRYAEWDYAISEIIKYPLSGKGMGSQVHFYNILYGQTYHTHNIHNGYIFLAYKLGLPMMLLYLAFLLYYTFKAFFMSIRKSNLFFKALSIACFLGLLSAWIANSTNASFFYKDGYFTIFLLIAFTSIADYNINPPKRIEPLSESVNNSSKEIEHI